MEGFGIVALEYMASQLIALGTNVGGLNEIVPVDENLFEIGDFKQLARRILEIDTIKKELIITTQNEFIKNYDIEHACSLHRQLYLS